MIIIIYFKLKVKNLLNNNQSKQKLIIFEFFFLIFNFYLRSVNTQGSSNVGA